MKTVCEPIEESLFPQNGTTYWSMFLTLETGAVLLSTMLILPLNWPDTSETILLGYLVAAVILAPLCMIFAWTQMDYLRRKNGRIVFDGEKFSVYSSQADGGGCRYEAMPSECRWFRGNPAWMTSCGLFGMSIGPVGIGKSLFLAFPDRCRVPEEPSGRGWYIESSPLIIAVGHTHESELHWIAVFRETGTERDIQRENTSPPVSPSYSTLYSWCVLIASIYAGLFCWNWSDGMLQRLGFDGDAPHVVSASFSLWLVILSTTACCTIFLRRPMSQEVKRLRPQSNMKWGMAIAMLVSSAILILPVWFFPGRQDGFGLSMSGKLALTTVTIPMATLTATINWILYAEPKSKQ